MKSPNIFRMDSTKNTKTIAHNTKRRRRRCRRKSKADFWVFGIARHLKRRMWRAKVPNLAFENWRSKNLTLRLNKKHVLFQMERSEEVLKTGCLVTTKATSPPELKKTFLERTQRLFGNFLFCLRKKSCFYKYSISQDIWNAGCK